MRIVLLGGSGRVGWELQRALAPLGEVVVLDRARGDLEDPHALRAALRHLRPEVIANAAAYTDVDRAEAEPERARRINAEGPAILAAEAKRLDAWLIHYSTDYVFDGAGAEPRCETDPAAPLNIYGQTKWQGEQAVRETGCRHLILRTQWIYSSRRRNFLRTVLRLAEERETMEIPDDQIGAPTGADLVADVTAVLVRSLAGPLDPGTYHVAAAGETTLHAYACFLVESARRSGWPLRLEASAIVPVASEALPAGARRPRNSRLRVERLERTFNLRMPDWRVGVARVLMELSEQRSATTGR